jgi:hypothetical protein
MLTSRTALVAAVASLAAWVVLALVMKIPSGWVHLPLAAGAILVAVAIVLGGSGAPLDAPRK